MKLLKKSRTWAEKHILAIGGSIMLIGLITIIFALLADIWLLVIIGLLILVSPPIIGLTAAVILAFSFFLETFMKPFFQWILWIRTQGFSVLLTREYGTQLIVVIFTFFVLCQSQILQKGLWGMLIIALIILSLFSESWPEELLPALPWSILFALLLILVTAIPGFFAGLLTGSEEKGKNPVGIGFFLATWAIFIGWAAEIFSWGVSGAWLVLIIFLILIGMIMLSFVVCGIGMFCGLLGEEIGIKVCKGILKTRIWKLKKSKEALAWELEDQLKELKEQLGRGHITQEEYEQKKKLLES